MYGWGTTVELITVAPFVGAWIEMLNSAQATTSQRVAPFVGAWIEMPVPQLRSYSVPSLRSSERGLKLVCHHQSRKTVRRSVRRSVD